MASLRALLALVTVACSSTSANVISNPSRSLFSQQAAGAVPTQPNLFGQRRVSFNLNQPTEPQQQQQRSADTCAIHTFLEEVAGVEEEEEDEGAAVNGASGIKEVQGPAELEILHSDNYNNTHTYTCRSTAISNGIEVSIHSWYMEKESVPETNSFTFMYEVNITNHNPFPVRVVGRSYTLQTHDGKSGREKITLPPGYGIWGETPLIRPGKFHAFESVAPITGKAPAEHGVIGRLFGSYQLEQVAVDCPPDEEDMFRGGTILEAIIAPFHLIVPPSVAVPETSAVTTTAAAAVTARVTAVSSAAAAGSGRDGGGAAAIEDGVAAAAAAAASSVPRVRRDFYHHQPYQYQYQPSLHAATARGLNSDTNVNKAALNLTALSMGGGEASRYISRQQRSTSTTAAAAGASSSSLPISFASSRGGVGSGASRSSGSSGAGGYVRPTSSMFYNT